MWKLVRSYHEIHLAICTIVYSLSLSVWSDQVLKNLIVLQIKPTFWCRLFRFLVSISTWHRIMGCTFHFMIDFTWNKSLLTDYLKPIILQCQCSPLICLICLCLKYVYRDKITGIRPHSLVHFLHLKIQQATPRLFDIFSSKNTAAFTPANTVTVNK